MFGQGLDDPHKKPWKLDAFLAFAKQLYDDAKENQHDDDHS